MNWFAMKYQHILKYLLAIYLFVFVPLSSVAQEAKADEQPYASETDRDDSIVAVDNVAMGTENEVAEAYDSVENQGNSNHIGKRADEIIASMTLEEKVAQLFIITPEALTGVSGVTMAGETTQAAFSDYPVGGIIYMEQNIQSWDQTSQMLSSMQDISMNRIGLPSFLSVDEEGGSVFRVSGRLENVESIPDMSFVGASQDPLNAYETGIAIGDYLNRLGFNVDFAPVADVLTNPENTVIGNRSFGSDPHLVANMVALEVQGLREQGICATLKHFPGHGNTSEDSHQGLAVSYRTLEELENCEFLPFVSGITAGAEFVMVGHIALPNVTGDDIPASLSYRVMTELLRNEMGFEGIILTDALNMGAIVNAYGSGEAAVKAFQAGADMILAPADFHTAYSALLEAVSNETISEKRLHESLHRIVELKLILEDA